MTRSKTYQLERAVEASPFRTPGFAVRRQVRVPFPGMTTGVGSRIVLFLTWEFLAVELTYFGM